MTTGSVRNSTGAMDALSEAAAGIRAATDWLVSRCQDSAFAAAAVAGAYRLPYALALAGRRADAARAMSWLERVALDPSGDLRPGPMRDVFSLRWSSYPLAILAQGAWHLERYQTAEAIRTTLRGFQDERTGGAYAQRPELRTSRRQDIFPTAQLGTTGLALGEPALADGAYQWLARLYELQPELPDRLYSATDGERLLCRPEDVADDRFGMVTEFNQPRQAFYNPGIAAAFLARYSAARGERAAAQLAAAYLELTESGGGQQFDHAESVQVCKFAWGAATLLDLTGGSRYRRHAERMVHWFRSAQHPDGHWENSPFLLPGGPTQASNLEVTAEFLQHLCIVSAALGGAGPTCDSC